MLFSLIALILCFGTHQPAHSAVIQILHTNDLHAALNTAGAPKPAAPEVGGWAQIKTLMDQLEQQAQSAGMETIRLDAGDFLEGTLEYFAQNGAPVLRAYQALEFDATALGNHDWLMGARGLNELLGSAPFSTPLLAANIKVHRRLQHLKQQLRPSTVIEKNGIKIGVVGLTTNEAFYKWIPRVGSKKNDMRIRDYWDLEPIPGRDDGEAPIPGIANQEIDRLAPQTDAVIALTHIGFGNDVALVQQSQNLDLVVGGHSHTFLETLRVEPNRDGREVPIVQTGYNGRNIGRVLIEILPGQPARVLSTELVPVPIETPRDPVVQTAIQKVDQALKTQYQKDFGPDYLDEPLGKSEVRLVPGRTGPTSFSQFAVEAMRKSIDADVAIDIGAFHANTPLPGGVITRRKLMQMYPRKFEADQNEGLYVYRARVPGFVIQLGVKFAVKYGIFVSFDGITYDVEKLSDSEFEKEKSKLAAEERESITAFRAKDIKIAGNKLCWYCFYDTAMPESLLRGAYGISPLTRLIIRHGHRTDQTIWKAFEKHLKDVQIIRALKDSDGNSPGKSQGGFAPKFYSQQYQRTHDGHVDPDQTHPEEEAEEESDDHDHSPGRVELPLETLMQRFFKEVQTATPQTEE